MSAAGYTTLVDVATLQAHLNDADWRVVDVRHALADPSAGERAYGEGHLPGAVFLHLDRDLSGPMNGRNGRHPLPDPSALVERLTRAGIGATTQVVVYDDAGGMIAGRLWWLLRWLGHERVALLDGGFGAWKAAGGALSSEPAKPVTPSATLNPSPRAAMRVTADEVLAGLNDASRCLLDARAADRFRGENETLDPVGGHIPGARNRFFKDNLESDGRMKAAATLREEFAALLGGRSADALIHQCGSGVSACLNMVAMEHAGLTGSRLYAGSWSEWCADPARPVATGAA